ncbi:MAG: MarR family transcriptional regulator [Chloroflexota bacterium]
MIPISVEDALVDTEALDALERIVIAGVGMTNAALNHARPRLDLTFPQWRVLVVLGGRPEGLGVQEIAQRIAVTLPATGRQLHRLAERGLLVLEPDARDRRVTRARLTEAGVAARTSIMGDRRARIAEGIAGVQPGADTVRDLERLAEALEAELTRGYRAQRA